MSVTLHPVSALVHVTTWQHLPWSAAAESIKKWLCGARGQLSHCWWWCDLITARRGRVCVAHGQTDTERTHSQRALPEHPPCRESGRSVRARVVSGVSRPGTRMSSTLQPRTSALHTHTHSEMHKCTYSPNTWRCSRMQHQTAPTNPPRGRFIHKVSTHTHTHTRRREKRP